MKPENAARTLAMIGAALLILVALLRLLSVYLLISDPRLQAGAPDAPGPDPALGLFAFSNDGQQVRFERGVFTDDIWQGGVYTLNLQDGSVSPGDLPAAPSQYGIDDGKIRLNQTDTGPRLLLSPTGMQVTNPIYSADGQALAFLDDQIPNLKRLYAIRGLSPAELIMEAAVIHSMAWSPTHEQLLFVSNDSRGLEIYVYSFANRQTTRLTEDGLVKSSPLFSPDGRQIAFLAADLAADAWQQTPTPARFQPVGSPPVSGVDIYVIDADGQNLRRLTASKQDEFGLAWTADGELAFSAWQPHWPAVAYLYAISPTNGAQHRLYPLVAIDAFTCQPVLPGGNQADVQVVVSNASSQAATIPVEVSADRQPLDLLTNRSQFRVQREDLPLAAGEARTLTWKVNVPEDIRVYLAASIETGVEFPISAAFCEVTPRRLFLPRLPLMRVSLLIALFGSILCLPWLRHAGRVGLWMLGGSYWLLLVGLIFVESLVLLNG